MDGWVGASPSGPAAHIILLLSLPDIEDVVAIRLLAAREAWRSQFEIASLMLATTLSDCFVAMLLAMTDTDYSFCFPGNCL